MQYLKFISICLILLFDLPIYGQQTEVIPFFGHDRWAFEAFSTSGTQESGKCIRTAFWTHASINNWHHASIGLRSKMKGFLLSAGIDYAEMGELDQYTLQINLSKNLGKQIALGLHLGATHTGIEGYVNHENYSTGLQGRFMPIEGHSFAAIIRIPILKHALPRFRMQYISRLSDEVSLQLDLSNNYTGQPLVGLSVLFSPDKNWKIELEQGISPIWTDLIISYRPFKIFKVDLINRYQPITGYSIGIGLVYVQGT